MKYSVLSLLVFCALTACSIPQPDVPDLKTETYYISNDSIEQRMELIILDSAHVQFILRVENKYLDTTDSYMALAAATEHGHFLHSRANCRIRFDMPSNRETLTLLSCDCAELTVSASEGTMKPDADKTKQ